MAAKILVVDDDPLSSKLVQRRLEEKGYSVILALTGTEGIEKCFAEMPDLVIMDLQLPDIDGYQAIQVLKNDGRTGHIPIIMLTASAGKRSQYWGIKTGADDFLTKPFAHNDLIQRIEALLGAQNATGRELATISGDSAPVASQNVILKVNQILDRKLYEATVINDVNNLAKSISDTKLLMESILVLLGRVMEHDVIGIYVPFEATLMVQGYDNNSLVEEFVQKVLAACGQHLDQQQGEAHEEGGISIIFKEAGAPPSTTGATTLVDFEAIPMVTVGGVVGIITVGTASAKGFSQQDRDIFKTIAGQASILLDNARLYAEMTKAANTDGLTKTFNHRSLQERLDQEFSRAKRYGTALSLVMLDIDNFKSFNDTYGHQQGDLLLSEVARLLREAIREGDIVARYGGEEFALILPETTPEGALILAERIRQRIEECSFPSAQGPLRITVSLGVAGLTPNMRDKGALIRSSDEALYSAKRTGRNRVCVA